MADPVRLAAVTATGLIERPESPVLDRITALAARLIGARTLVTLVQEERQCFVSRGGPGAAPAFRETPLSHSYCQYVVESGEPMVVPDARLHPLLHDNPAISEHRAIGYLGVPLRSPDGHVLGTLCAVDREPRDWTGDDVRMMEDLACAATAEIAARMAHHEAAQATERTQRILGSTLDAFVATDPAGRITGWNHAAERMFGWDEPEVLGRTMNELIIAPADRREHSAWMMAASFETEVEGRRVELQGVQRGGRQFPIELSLTAVDRPGGMAAYMFVRDLTALRRGELLRNLEYSVAGALAAAEGVEQATDAVVARVAESLGWPYIEYWHLDSDETRMIRLAVAARDRAVTAPMEEYTSFARGVGVVGEVWAAASARWIRDLPALDMPRAAAAARAGLTTAVAVPVRNGTHVVGVLAAFERRRTEPDAELMAALDTIATHIGQYVHRRRAEELELELSRARSEFDRVVSNLSDFLWTVRIDGPGDVEMIYASHDRTSIFGGMVPSNDTLSEVTTSMVHPEDQGLFEAFGAEMMTGRPAQITCRVIGADGVTRWIWGRAIPRFEGEVLYVDGVCSDVTERQHDQEQLRQQAELLDLAPIAVIVKDLEDRVTYWNKGAESTYGWDADAALGCPTHRLLDTRFPVLHTLVDSELARTGEWHGELDHLRSDGTRITVLSHMAMQYDDAGHPVAILEVNIDVTARKLAERRMADSEKRLRTQFSLATVGQATIALNGSFQQVNPALAAMLGRSVPVVESMTLDDITHPDERADNHRAAARLFTQDLPLDRHLRMLHADGHIVDAAMGMSLVRDSDGQPVSFIAVLQDVTARLAAERDRDAAAAQLAERNGELQDSNTQLAAANALKLDLMGMLSHEIGTPLNTISAYAELLLGNLDDIKPAHRKAVEVIARSARRLEVLRAEVLTMCTLDAGEINATPEPVRLGPALGDVLAGLEVSPPVSCEGDLTVLVHPSHLQQIVTNYCTNAAKYGGGVSAIVVERRGGNAVIAVEDRGEGIPEDLRPHLFDRYTRAAGLSSSIKGHGLGLYIVKGLAEANHGAAGYEPNPEGGSRFTLTLPIAQPAIR
ncbi:PAS domain S-box protein [Actinoplanes sp. DH11]|uniref:PAS domain S-box protein n=1 Tax=Actinoplanes sp. DH11 TaxID=2857011 RepID=UPI001E373BC3|nr:PAS domain S-box protein [Actinoplanes sp. DH11]